MKTVRLLMAAAAVAAVVAPAAAEAGVRCTLYWHETGLVPPNPYVADPKVPDCAW